MKLFLNFKFQQRLDPNSAYKNGERLQILVDPSCEMHELNALIQRNYQQYRQEITGTTIQDEHTELKLGPNMLLVQRDGYIVPKIGNVGECFSPDQVIDCLCILIEYPNDSGELQFDSVKSKPSHERKVQILAPDSQLQVSISTDVVTESTSIVEIDSMDPKLKIMSITAENYENHDDSGAEQPDVHNMEIDSESLSSKALSEVFAAESPVQLSSANSNLSELNIWNSLHESASSMSATQSLVSGNHQMIPTSQVEMRQTDTQNQDEPLFSSQQSAESPKSNDRNSIKTDLVEETSNASKIGVAYSISSPGSLKNSSKTKKESLATEPSLTDWTQSQDLLKISQTQNPLVSQTFTDKRELRSNSNPKENNIPLVAKTTLIRQRSFKRLSDIVVPTPSQEQNEALLVSKLVADEANRFSTSTDDSSTSSEDSSSSSDEENQVRLAGKKRRRRSVLSQLSKACTLLLTSKIKIIFRVYLSSYKRERTIADAPPPNINKTNLHCKFQRIHSFYLVLPRHELE